MILRPVKAAVTLRATNDKTAGGVDQVAGVFEPFFGQHRLDDFFNDGFGERGLHFGLCLRLVGAVLGGQNHGVYAVGFAIHITHGHLTFSVGAQKRQSTIAAQLRLALDQTVGVINGRRHEVGGFAAGITKHQALVASANVQVVV